MVDEQDIWNDLEEVFRDAVFTLWTHAYESISRPLVEHTPCQSGFDYAQTDDPDRI